MEIILLVNGNEKSREIINYVKENNLEDYVKIIDINEISFPIILNGKLCEPVDFLEVLYEFKKIQEFKNKDISERGNYE